MMKSATRRRYGDIVREKMLRGGRSGEPITIRMVEKATGYTYEHIRKVVKNLPVVSHELNEAICRYLDLDEEKMWGIAQSEKLERKAATLPSHYSPPLDPRLKALWPRLLPADVDKIRRIAERMADDNEAAGLVPRRSRG